MPATAISLLAGIAIASLFVTLRPEILGGEASLAFSVAAILAAGGVTAASAWQRSGEHLRLVVASPLAPVLAWWLGLFVLRPIELYFAPDRAGGPLQTIGFGVLDLARSEAMVALGCTTFCLGYLLALGTSEGLRRTTDLLSPTPLAAMRRMAGSGLWRQISPRRPLPFSPRWSAVLLAVGTCLWFALFIRQGGPAALLGSAATIREDGGSSGFGFLGIWMTQGVALYSLVCHLQTRSRVQRRFAVAAIALSLAAGLCLQARGTGVFVLIAAAIIILRMRVPTRRQAVAALAVVAVAIPSLAFLGQVRAYSSLTSTERSVELAAQTNPLLWIASETSIFDNLVAVRSLVPGSVDHLDGRSLANIPTAVVPRALWPDKPVALDQEVTSIFFPGLEAGLPIAFQGELYWNFGIPGVIVGGLLLGLAGGAVGRFGLRRATGGMSVILFAVTALFFAGFVTRGLAVAFSGWILTIIGVASAVWLAQPHSRPDPRRLKDETGRRLRRLRARAARLTPSGARS